MKKLFKASKDTNKKKPSAASAAPASAQAPSPAPPKPAARSGDDGDIIAAITAALSAYLGGSVAGSMPKVVVRPLRRASDTWISVGKTENVR